MLGEVTRRRVAPAHAFLTWKERRSMSDTVATPPGQTISVENFKSGLLFVLDETFDNVHGAYLDPGDSFFATLAEITAEQASRSVGSGCASIAAQLNHVIF